MKRHESLSCPENPALKHMVCKGCGKMCRSEATLAKHQKHCLKKKEKKRSGLREPKQEEKEEEEEEEAVADDDGPVQCDICCRVLESSRELRDHVRDAHERHDCREGRVDREMKAVFVEGL